VFACDPTSADGLLHRRQHRQNAGGKKAVLWGTALDNLASWRMVDPQGRLMEVTRLDHNLGKIHDAAAGALFHPALRRGRPHPRRRARTAGDPPPGFRRAGLGKDVTDKFLAGLPGCRRRAVRRHHHLGGVDPAQDAAVTRTVCLEFFGQVREAVPSIVEIKTYLDGLPKSGEARVMLAGLEHLDERYVRAGGLRHQGQAPRPAQ